MPTEKQKPIFPGCEQWETVVKSENGETTVYLSQEHPARMRGKSAVYKLLRENMKDVRR